MQFDYATESKLHRGKENRDWRFDGIATHIDETGDKIDRFETDNKMRLARTTPSSHLTALLSFASVVLLRIRLLLRTALDHGVEQK
jgi:hypothetical protein